MAADAGQAMNEINNSSDSVVDAVNAISAALRQQSSSSAQIAQNIESIAATSEKNAIAVKDVAAASGRLQESADSLQAAVARFRI